MEVFGRVLPSAARRISALVTLSLAGGLKAGAVLARGKTSLKGKGSIRLVATKAATKALRSGKVHKAKVLIRSGGKTSVRVIALK